MLRLEVKRESERYVVYDLGACDLVLSVGAPATAISFVTGDLDEALGRIRRQGATVAQEIQESGEGRLAVVQDPDGNAVELIQ